MEKMSDWYGLKPGHSDFQIENDANAAFFFARAQLDAQLQSILRRSFRTGNPPKFVLYGDWGVGKTHTLRHIEFVIRTTAGYEANVIFLELPDITARATFQVAHAGLLDALGLDTVKNWMLQFQTKHQSQSKEMLQRSTQSEDISKAFLTLIGYGDAARICWDWLRGVDLPPAEARSAGLSPSIEQSTQLVNVLRTLGRLSREIDGRILILMLDEGAKLQSVTNADAISHWVNVFKILADMLTKELGFIVSASFRDPDDMPDPLSDQQIRSRFGDNHYIQMPNFGSAEANEFTRALVYEWIDPGKRDQLIKNHGAECDNEKVTDHTFPFTEKALARFIEYACRNGGITNPRDIQQALDDFLNRAIDDNRHMLSSKYLDGVLAAG